MIDWVVAASCSLQTQSDPNDLAARRMDTEIFRLLTVSTLPATSQDRYCTVVVALIVNGPAYVGLLSVGVVPLVCSACWTPRAARAVGRGERDGHR